MDSKARSPAVSKWKVGELNGQLKPNLELMVKYRLMDFKKSSAGKNSARQARDMYPSGALLGAHWHTALHC